MVRSGTDFTVVVDLCRGVHEYKFIVDEQWRFAQDQPLKPDDGGNVNNVVDITQYHGFPLEVTSERLVTVSEFKYEQKIMPLKEYNADAPAIPLLLSKSNHCCFDATPGKAVPNIPLHCMANHYFDDCCSTLAKHGVEDVASLVVVRRFREKMGTSVIVTKSPFALADGSRGAPGNPMKSRVTRR
mmetsp:Transcript_119855/g.274594  ORF Transcript_119855/g.274594 Transcript_119855/m.274594 type:complete len:185 (-) Transcript_119855:36-590(-)